MAIISNHTPAGPGNHTVITLYYVIEHHDDTRHATRENPNAAHHHPYRPVSTLCGRTVHAALPGDNRAPPASRLPNGDIPFCPTCVQADACLSAPVQRIFTTENWLLRTTIVQQAQP